MYPSIVEVIAGTDHTLFVKFDNGEKGVLDMTPYLDFGVFRGIKERSVFEQARLSFDAIEWPGGIDLDPEFVYQHCRKDPVPMNVSEEP